MIQPLRHTGLRSCRISEHPVQLYGSRHKAKLRRELRQICKRSQIRFGPGSVSCFSGLTACAVVLGSTQATSEDVTEGSQNTGSKQQLTIQTTDTDARYQTSGGPSRSALSAEHKDQRRKQHEDPYATGCVLKTHCFLLGPHRTSLAYAIVTRPSWIVHLPATAAGIVVGLTWSWERITLQSQRPRPYGISHSYSRCTSGTHGS